MAIAASSISTSNTLEQLRSQFNNLVSDVTGLEAGTQTFSAITATSSTITTVNVAEDGKIVFEGATADEHETTLTVVDPTADRTVTFPNASGTVIISDSSTNVTTLPDDLLIKDGGTIGNASVADVLTLASTGIVTFKDDLLIKDGGTIGVASSTSAITIASSGIVTFVDDILIKNGGTIGVAGDADSITIASDGQVSLTQTLTGTDANFSGVATATTFEPDGDTAAGDNAAIGFTNVEGLILTGQGSTNDVTVKNDADAIVMQIATGGTATEFIGNVTVGGNLDVTGTFDLSDQDFSNVGSIQLDSIAGDADTDTSITFSGSNIITVATGGSTAATFNASQVLTLSGNLLIPDAGTIGSASDTNAIGISSGGVVSITATTANTDASDGALTVAGGASVAADFTVGDDLRLLSDSAVMSFGANSEVTLTHVADTGLTLTHTGTGDNLPVVLQLKSEEDAVIANEVIASLEFAAGDSDGTDGATVAAGIHAIAEGTFSASANATKLVFTTGVSETAASSATAKMTLSSAGLLTIADDFMIKDGGTIGVASTNDAITISSAGIVTFKDDILIKDGGTIGVASSTSAITISSGGIVTLVDDLIIKDGGTIGAASSTGAITIASSGIVTLVDDLLIKDGGTIGVASSTSAITIASTGIVTFVDDILIKDSGTIGSASSTGAITIASTGIVSFVDDITIKDGGTIGTATDADSITIAAAGAVTFSQKDVHSVGMSIKNGSSSAGFIEFFENSGNGTNKVTLIGPASTGDVTLTLPSATETLATAGDVTALAIALG